MASEGPVYRLALHAVSDEWLLDKSAAGLRSGSAFATSSASVLETLANIAGHGLFTTGTVTNSNLVGVFVPGTGTSWSGHAGSAAQAAFGAYRILNGTVTLQTMPGATHTLNVGDGSLTASGLKLSQVKELSNDVTCHGRRGADGLLDRNL